MWFSRALKFRERIRWHLWHFLHTSSPWSVFNCRKTSFNWFFLPNKPINLVWRERRRELIDWKNCCVQKLLNCPAAHQSLSSFPPHIFFIVINNITLLQSPKNFKADAQFDTRKNLSHNPSPASAGLDRNPIN